MSLEFADFAHHYHGSGMTDAERQDDFEVYASFMECLICYFWRREPVPNALGISFDKDTMALVAEVDSIKPLHKTFNDAAHEDAARKIAP